MNYQCDDLSLECLHVIRKGSVNDTMICQDNADSQHMRYLVLAIKDHNVAKKFLRICTESRNSMEGVLITQFSSRGQHILVFPYVKERLLKDFFVGEALSLKECEAVSASLVLSCINSGVPYQILYLMLKQMRVNISKDNTVYLDYSIDLEGLDEEKKEKDCVVLCARMVLDILKDKQNDKADSYTLVKKREASSGYRLFAELYKDISIASAPRSKYGFLNRFVAVWRAHRDTLFKLLLFVCIVTVLISVLTLGCQLIFGDVPWLGYLSGSFEHIGTENLLQ